METISAAWPLLAVRAVTTLTIGGVSAGPYRSMNLAAHVGDDPERVWANRTCLRDELNLPSNPRWLNQVHGVNVVDVASITNEAPPDADGGFALERGLVCAVLTADCLPVVLADRRARCVAVVHAGWRGLHGGVIESAIEALPVPAESLVAWLGPAIGPASFEVGEDVREAFGAGAACAFRATNPGHYLADIYALARLRLRVAGVGSIYGGGLCTRNDPRFFSYRRTKVCGRMATLAWII